MEILLIMLMMIAMLVPFGVAAFACDVIIPKFPKLEKLIDKVTARE